MYRKERHSVSDIKVHLICITKYRRSVLNEAGLLVIEDSFKAVAMKMNFVVLEFNGEADHVHALIEYPPKLSISQIANAVKGVSSRRYGQAGYKKPHPESSVVGRKLPPDKLSALWSPSYFAVSVGGAPIEILKKYIQNQSRPPLR